MNKFEDFREIINVCYINRINKRMKRKKIPQGYNFLIVKTKDLYGHQITKYRTNKKSILSRGFKGTIITL